jgi:translation initiation factor 2B subunit (eIF-2B alpha/beta/delta family)
MKKGVKKSLSSDERRFNKIISDIKSIKIQGANSVARAGLEAFLLFPTKKHAKEIVSARPTEPMLQNFIKILLKSKDLKKTSKLLLNYMEYAQKQINQAGETLIQNNFHIFSHCHSSSVIEMLKHAKKQGKEFIVYTAEVEPLLQGRQTAKDLAKAGIKVIVMPDLSAEYFLKKCDLFFFGADAYTRRFIYNKIGTSTLTKLASLYNIPSYSLGFSLKYTKHVKIEKRKGREVWDERNPNIEVKNYAFDKIKGRTIKGVISESGILPYNKFVKIAKQNLKSFSKLS